MTNLNLTLHADGGQTPLAVAVRRMVNAGYVGRNQDAVRAHVEELAREGVPPPSAVPVLFPVMLDKLTTAERIEVIGPHTSGEAEYVLLLVNGEVYVGVGSD